jgi:acyl-CoA thioesterase YciA
MAFWTAENTLVSKDEPRLKFDSNFTIMPQDCNYTQKVVFGGTMLAQMDITAAACVARLLRISDFAESAVTHIVENVTFLKPSHVGDIIFLHAEVVEMRKKAIVVQMRVEKEERCSDDRTLVATGKFVFVAMNGDSYVHHGLDLEDDGQ